MPRENESEPPIDLRNGNQSVKIDVKTLIILFGFCISASIGAYSFYNGIANKIDALDAKLKYNVVTVDAHAVWEEQFRASNTNVNVPRIDDVFRALREKERQMSGVK
jgi:hypothetical protein